MVDLTDGVSYMKAANEALRNDGLATKFTDSQIQNTILGKDQYLYRMWTGGMRYLMIGDTIVVLT